jgi:hypothetical protein
VNDSHTRNKQESSVGIQLRSSPISHGANSRTDSRPPKSAISGLVLLVAVSGIFGCSSQDVIDAASEAVFSRHAEISINVTGDSRYTKISYIVVEEDDDNYLEIQNRFLDGKNYDLKVSVPLPWSDTLIIESGEILLLQVDATDFDKGIKVQILKDGILQKEHVKNIRALPPVFTSFSL